jgi:uncharacterized protein (TIGR02996 family)
MIAETAFLRAIRDDPDSDGPRLVYADWLDERGDPRGEFIRVQCRLERLSADDPEAEALRRREAELRERHRAEWEALRRSLKLSDWAFRRGLVEEVTLAVHDFVAQARRLFELLAVRQVRLEGLTRVPQSLLEALAVEPLLGRVRRLDLSNNRAPSGQVDPVLSSSHLAALTWLDLRGNPLDLDTLRLLAAARHLPRLTTVLLRRAELAWLEPTHALWGSLQSRYHGIT